jgi:hypothetical protein
LHIKTGNEFSNGIEMHSEMDGCSGSAIKIPTFCINLVEMQGFQLKSKKKEFI